MYNTNTKDNDILNLNENLNLNKDNKNEIVNSSIIEENDKNSIMNILKIIS